LEGWARYLEALGERLVDAQLAIVVAVQRSLQLVARAFAFAVGGGGCGALPPHGGCTV